jgi:Cu/Ag efflux pump CusA
MPVVVTAILFGVYHLTAATIIPAVFLGLIFGLLVVRTGSLLPAILAHTANNATAIATGHLAVDSFMVAGLLAAAFLPLAVAVWVRTRQNPPRASPLVFVPAAVPAVTPLRLVGLTAGAVILAVSLFAVPIFNVHRVADASFEPELDQGDLAIVAVDASRQRVLRAGDIVEIDRELAKELGGRRLASVLEVTGGRHAPPPAMHTSPDPRSMLHSIAQWGGAASAAAGGGSGISGAPAQGGARRPQLPRADSSNCR